MSLDPDERLAALRREIEAETPKVSTAPPPVPSTPAPSAPTAKPTPAPAPMPKPVPPARPSPATDAAAPVRSVVPELGVPEPGEDPTDTAATRDGWDLQDLLADTSLATWLGIGLLAIGGYLVLSWFVPGIDLIGSIIILGAGVVLLAQHFMRGSGAWALYAGAVLTGVGAARVISDILPGSPRGLTAAGVGVAFLAISYLRHTQAGGYGWQGMVGAVALGLGGIQFVLGLLPGSPSVLDLILPLLLLGGGAFILLRARDRTQGA